jgi:hypothetical protein
MADITIAKGSTKAVTSAQHASGESAGKTGLSKFDEIRAKLTDKVAVGMKLPPPMVISEQQQAMLETALRKRLSGTSASNATQLFGVDMQNAQLNLQNLSRVINKLPNETAFAPLRDRLHSIEKQFQNSGELIKGVKGMDPHHMLKVQMQLYQVSENIELLSKVVDQVSSGVKTIFQTQV